MAVRIFSGASFSPCPPQKLFVEQFYSKGVRHTGYDVSPDGQRFVMVQEAASGNRAPSRPQIIVVQNRLDELKRLVSSR